MDLDDGPVRRTRWLGLFFCVSVPRSMVPIHPIIACPCINSTPRNRLAVPRRTQYSWRPSGRSPIGTTLEGALRAWLIGVVLVTRGSRSQKPAAGPNRRALCTGAARSRRPGRRLLAKCWPCHIAKDTPMSMASRRVPRRARALMHGRIAHAPPKKTVKISRRQEYRRSPHHPPHPPPPTTHHPAPPPSTTNSQIKPKSRIPPTHCTPQVVPASAEVWPDPQSTVTLAMSGMGQHTAVSGVAARTAMPTTNTSNGTLKPQFGHNKAESTPISTKHRAA